MTQKVSVRIGSLLLAVTLPGVTAAARPPAVDPRVSGGGGGRLPIYVVKDKGLSKKQSARLDRLLHLDGKPRPRDGSLVYADEQRFLFVPGSGGQSGSEDGQDTISATFDLQKINRMRALSKRAAKGMVGDVMDEAGIDLHEDFNLRSSFKATQTFFDIYSLDGQRTTHVPLETEVRAKFTLGGLPLVGPGASLTVGFGSHPKKKQRDVVSDLAASIYEVKKGGTVPIMSEGQAAQECASRFQSQARGTAQPVVDTRLVYYAPPLQHDVKALFPHYECRGTADQQAGRLIFRPIFLLAGSFGPQITLQANVGEFTDPHGFATVTGGTPPYSYVWTSSTTPIPTATATAGNSVTYFQRPRNPAQEEILSVTVWDANGLTATASANLGVVGGTPPPAPTPGGGVEVGTEWIGLIGGLPGSYVHANAFADRFRAEGIPVEFNYGDFAAYEEDFKFVGAPGGGNDVTYADDVDLTFYTGHAGDWGFSFAGNDDPWLTFSDARWGDRDLEWLAIAACGPLQEVDGAGRTRNERWGPAFQGLHAILGYTTISYDNYDEGRLFANNLLNEFGIPPIWSFSMTVVEAWAQMARGAQPDVPAPDTVMWGAMGPIGAGGATNFFDPFWGRRTIFGTGPSADIPPAQITGYWFVGGPA